MENRIEEAQREFDKILEDVKNMAAGGDIQKIEEEIFSKLGRVLMELSTTKTSKVCRIVD